MKRSWPIEESLWLEGVRLIGGIDEAGRGSLAGPIVAAAVILPPMPSFPWISQLDDSKELTPKVRKELYSHILKDAVAVAVASLPPEEIDRRGIFRATLAAMAQAAKNLSPQPDILLIDGPWPLPEVEIRQMAIIDGDARCCSVACASIVAKVERDRMMEELHRLAPGYGFDRNKGYGTLAHWEAVRSLGPSPWHRRSFLSRRARELGQIAEDAAALYLAQQGWRILERNYRTRHGEIDLVAWDGRWLAFVEVKARMTNAYGGPEEAFTLAKRRRLREVAEAYLQEKGVCGEPRIDAVLVRLSWGGDVVAVEHLPGAVEGP